MDDREKNSDELIQELSELRWKNRELEDEVQELRSQAAAGEKEQWVQLERDKFYSLAEASPFGLVVTSQDGTYEYINPRFTEMFGYELSDLPNGSAWLRNAYPNENYRKEAVDAWFEDLKRTKQGDLRPRIFTVRCKDGTDKVIHFRLVQLTTGQDLMTCEDITEYTKIDNDLKQANLETNALLESARSIIENSDFRTAAQFILTSANKLVGSTVGHIILLNSEGSEHSLMYFESGGLPCDVDPKAPISVTGFHALAYEKKRAFYKNDLLSGIPILELPKNHVHLENFLLSPLIVRNKALGLLGLANKPGGFTEGDAKLVESFSEVLAVGLLNWQMSQDLEQSEERYRMIFAHSPFGIMHYDKDGVIIDCNDRFVEILGSSRERLHGFKMLEELRDPKLLEGIGMSLTSKTGYYEGDYHSVTGNRDIPLRAVFNSVRSEDGRFLGGIGIYEDMSKIRAAEKALLQAERVKAVADLAGGVAHNFNNLLQMIMGSLEVSLMDLESGGILKARKILERMRDSVTLGAETVKRLQTFARVRATETPADQTVFDVSQTMAQAVEMTKPLWKDAPEKDGVSIKLTQKLEKGVMVKGQANQIFEVMLSIVTNAAEACVTGGKIDVSSYPENDYAVIEVKDTGIGIAEADLKRVFDPFWTSKKTRIGTGMGLAVSHSIVESHRGSITVTSKQGQGSTFTLRLPLVKDVTLETASPEQTVMSFSRNVLVVDDMEPIVEMLGDVLTELGHSAFTATSGSEAIRIYESNKVDIVICDLMMPGMDGWKVGQAIAAICVERGVAKTPFVLLTGWGGQQMENELIRKSGVDALLEKPIDMTRLAEVITRLTTGESNSVGPNQE